MLLSLTEHVSYGYYDNQIFVGEGEYICPVCTIFGLEDAEVQVLIDSGLKMTDHNVEDEGYEVEISAFKVNLIESLLIISY